MKLLRFFLAFFTLFLAALLTLPFASCTKTVTQTEIDTLRVPVRDTLHGPVLMRFISMLPDGRAIYLKQSSSVDAPIYLSIPSGSSPQYIIIPDSGVVYYLFLSNFQLYDSLPIPVRPANSFWTCALFKDSNITRFDFSNDSAKFSAAPAGDCFLRFCDGIATLPPSTPQLYLDVDSPGNSPFKQDNGQSIPVGWGNINTNGYTPIPAGIHNILIGTGQKQVASQSQAFLPGGYYTVRVYGTGETDIHLDIDQD